MSIAVTRHTPLFVPTVALLFLALLFLLNGCASVKPFGLCRVADGKFVVMQGISGIGVPQDLPDADPMCAALKSPARAASSP